ncbi:MAG: alkaline phosphatase family protein [Desulfobacterales bacterium]
MIYAKGQRIIILMIDGFDMDYYHNSHMPVMQRLAAQGIFKSGRCIFPSLTNANNISIACGCWPENHGVTTNCYFNEVTGTAEFLEDASFLCAPTIFDQALTQGVQSALLTCKSKTTKILGKSVALAVAAEAPGKDIEARFGSPPPMYSADINYWLCKVGLDIIHRQPEIGLLYLHTTDYPMHMWPCEAPESQAHMSKLDVYLGMIREAAPEAVIILTADHGMNYKKRCWDLSKACSNRGLPLRFAVSPVADRLVKHHRGFGGVSYVYLNDNGKREEEAIELIKTLDGVEDVLDRQTAATRFKLMASRIGDLVVLPDIDTVFGDLQTESEQLDPAYRSHGSLHEMDIPLLLFNPKGAYPDPEEIQHNIDLTRLLFN